MAGFQQLVKGFKNGASTAIQMRNVSTGAITDSAGDCRSDALELAKEAQGIHANADGNVSVVDCDGNTAVFVLAAGGYYPFRFKQIRATGTTLAAADFNILYAPY